ncbi:MAG: hypothetical protein ABIH89_04970 [Elusimicrobiota bacterium]
MNTKWLRDLIRKVCFFCTPLLITWVAGYYLWLIFHLNSRNSIHAGVTILLFIPVILYELVLSRLFPDGKVLGRNWTGTVHAVLRILFWLVLYLYLTVHAYFPDNDYWAFLNFPPRYFFSLTWSIYLAESYISVLMFILWLIAYYGFAVKRRVFRIFSSLLLPVFFSYLLMQHFYFAGGLGDRPTQEIVKQAGVDVVYAAADFPKTDYIYYTKWNDTVRFHPRSLYYDNAENALYCVYAETMIETPKRMPTLLRIDLNTKKTDYFAGFYIRDVWVGNSSLMAAPWFEKKIYELEKKDLSVRRVFALKEYRYNSCKVRDIFKDRSRNCVYITYDMDARLQKYDYKTGELIGTMEADILKKFGTVELWLMQVSETTGMIYLAVQGPGKIDLLEVDPDRLEITRTLDLDIVEVCALKLDDKNKVIYCQDWGTNRLCIIDIESFTVKRQIRGCVHSRKIHIDEDRNCLYLLSYIYGKLTAVDIDTGRRYWELNTGGKPYGLAYGGDMLYINSRAGIISVKLEEVWRASQAKRENK